MKNSKIQWTDHTFNPWIGCTKVSPGCANCYAETRDQRFSGGIHWGKGAPRHRTSANNWREPMKWDREAGEEYRMWQVRAQLHGLGAPYKPRRPRVFCSSLADWLDDEVHLEWLVDLLDLIRQTPSLNWLLLTKRPENWYRRIAEAGLTANYASPRNGPTAEMALAWIKGTPPTNVWIGTTVEDQARADQRIPLLLSIPEG